MEFSCSNFLAHKDPDVLLIEHLKQVGLECERKLKEMGSDDELIKLGKIIGLTHDFGKYTEYFQERLKLGRTATRNTELYSHAPLSSIYTAYVCYREFRNASLALFGAYCVWNHHRNLSENLVGFTNNLMSIPENPNYRRQIESLLKNEPIISSELEEFSLPKVRDFSNFVNSPEYGSLMTDMLRSALKSYGYQDLIRLLLLFSILIDSDKKAAARIPPYTRKKLDLDAVRAFVQGLADEGSEINRINEIREKLRKSAIRNFENIITRANIPRIMYIHAPTGSGKTLLAFECALRLREEIERREGRRLRIIYVLPYINIVEQTYDVIVEALNLDKEEAYDVVLKHHHLHVPGDGRDTEDSANEEKLLLTESWEAEVVVTTFVQFMQTLLGTRNRLLKKFHKLLNSIIIVDEVQSVRPELWKLVSECIKELSRHSYLILMSATLPPLLVEEVGAAPIVEGSDEFFSSLNRVTYEYRSDELTVDELADFVLQRWNEESLLVVTNTIRTSVLLYNLLKEKLSHRDVLCLGHFERPDDGKKPILAYLSTNIIPADRLARIKRLKQETQRRPVLLVSTQTVEAGVDLDFKTVIRDIAPLDSIVQAAGRCNRNWKSDSGTVYIVRVKSSKGFDSKMIYGSLAIDDLTLPFFSTSRVYKEHEIHRVIGQYYREQVTKLSLEYSDESRCFLEAIRSLDMSKLAEFSVIKREPKAAVFVNLDDASDKELRDLRSAWDLWRQERGYSALSRLRLAYVRAREYIVDTWYAEHLPTVRLLPEQMSDDIRLIDRNTVDKYYSEETGLLINGVVDDFVF